MFSYFSSQTMRLNEKNVAAFAAAPTPVDKDGWLQKKGELNKGYQRRWFSLKGNLLFYSERQGDREPLGVIVLEKCSVGLCDGGDPYSFYIAFEGQGARTYVLVADNEADMTSWIKAISHAGYDYLRMMVDELKRRLERLQAGRSGTADPFEAVQAVAGAKGSVRRSAPELMEKDRPDSAALPRHHTVAQSDVSASAGILQPVPAPRAGRIRPVLTEDSGALKAATMSVENPGALTSPGSYSGMSRQMSERRIPSAVNRTQASFVSHTQPTTTTLSGMEQYRLSNGPDGLGKKPVRSFIEMHSEFGVPIQHILDKQEGVNSLSSSFTLPCDQTPVAGQPMKPVT